MNEWKNAKEKQLLVPHIYSAIDSKYQESIQETTNVEANQFI